MFNVLVAANDAAWESARMMMSVSRFKEYSGDEARAISEHDPSSLRLLESVPTLLIYETLVEGNRGDIVRYGQLRGIRKDGAELTFRFSEDGRLSRQRIIAELHRFQLVDWEMDRTHWAIKDGYPPQDIIDDMITAPKTYDIVLSFAGENRAYVEEVATILGNAGVTYFYDKNEAASLWGKDLSEHLDLVYRRGGRYCVMFVSKAYADKIWTSHERRSALSRAVELKREYILPVRFDNTEVPGLRPSVVYQDAKIMSPAQLAQLILQKLGRA
jgi:hypothetical protein